MLPVLTRPLGSRKAILESFASALKERNASANDSAFFLPNPAEPFCCPPLTAEVAEAAPDDPKSPVHALGVAQAFGGGGVAFASSVAGSFTSPPSVSVV